ncbi:unnamed protein product [Trypanosoma congolense IL3000]|uniref:WGS project CAEQ00000000 data, annotated contig 1283 n=1 Tax=Trypanosoma congolense (strain IL3000) TaxID=1068625 RepID=F9W571_TRYCI|nr:unnamed protein product [Trypanosoma congolense IL3000]
MGKGRHSPSCIWGTRGRKYNKLKQQKTSRCAEEASRAQWFLERRLMWHALAQRTTARERTGRGEQEGGKLPAGDSGGVDGGTDNRCQMFRLPFFSFSFLFFVRVCGCFPLLTTSVSVLERVPFLLEAWRRIVGGGRRGLWGEAGQKSKKAPRALPFTSFPSPVACLVLLFE